MSIDIYVQLSLYPDARSDVTGYNCHIVTQILYVLHLTVFFSQEECQVHSFTNTFSFLLEVSE